MPLDVQVVSATHQDLAGMIQAKAFREDLFYRLSGMTFPCRPCASAATAPS